MLLEQQQQQQQQHDEGLFHDEEEYQGLLEREARFYTKVDYLQQRRNAKDASHNNSNANHRKRKQETNSSSTCSRKAEKTQASSSPRPKQKQQQQQRQPDVTSYWREKIISWAYVVVDHFDMNREIVAIAADYMDRFLANTPVDVRVSIETFQLLSMTTLYMSIKLHHFKYISHAGASTTLESVLSMCQGRFTVPQMEAMEVEVLQRLQWHLHPPTAQQFSRTLLLDPLIRMLQQDKEDERQASSGALTRSMVEAVKDHVNFSMEVAVLDYELVCSHPASAIATAAVANAMHLLPGPIAARILTRMTRTGTANPWLRARLESLTLQMTTTTTTNATVVPPEEEDQEVAANARSVAPKKQQQQQQQEREVSPMCVSEV